MGSKLVCRMAKVKKNDVKGYQIHNQRERESKTNPDISSSLSHLNRDYINAKHISYMEKWKEIFESQNESKRALRKDAVFFNEFVVGSDRDFFKDMDQSEKERFFKVSTDFFKERFGEQNVLYSVAHFDELKGAGAHAHIAIVPMKGGKLQSKNVFDRNELKALQSELPQYLQKHGFDIERGKEGSKAQHIDTATYKVLKSQETVLIAEQQLETIQSETKLLEAKKEDLKELFEKVERIDTLEYEEQKSIFGKETGNIVIDREDFEQLKDLAMMVAPEMEYKNKDLKREVKILQSKIQEKDDKIVSLEKKYERASAQAERYKEGLNDVVEERVEERLEEKTMQLKKKHQAELGKSYASNQWASDQLKATDRKLENVQRSYKILEGQYNRLEKEKKDVENERNELVEENTFLKSKTQELFDYINNLKAKTNEQVNRRVASMLDVVRKSIHLATGEWLSSKFPEQKGITIDHLISRSEIDKRSTVLAIELAEEQDKKKIKEKDNDYER